MATPTNGKVVLVRFPFSDLSATKLRPALVLAQAGRGDVILCQITSQPYSDRAATELFNADFAVGTLRRQSYVRPAKLFTSNDSIIDRIIGTLKDEKFEEVLGTVRSLFEPKGKT
ncbi:MAG: type II toxin-antitoxin system PemK/MazF family toxin [Acidobacteria bacterium]|nr:type II toxin-antitoxin system PemK/MazF family toxin [Acidobacteriota bacterium]